MTHNDNECQLCKNPTWTWYEWLAKNCGSDYVEEIKKLCKTHRQQLRTQLNTAMEDKFYKTGKRDRN